MYITRYKNGKFRHHVGLKFGGLSAGCLTSKQLKYLLTYTPMSVIDKETKLDITGITKVRLGLLDNKYYTGWWRPYGMVYSRPHKDYMTIEVFKQTAAKMGMPWLIANKETGEIKKA